MGQIFYQFRFTICQPLWCFIISGTTFPVTVFCWNFVRIKSYFEIQNPFTLLFSVLKEPLEVSISSSCLFIEWEGCEWAMLWYQGSSAANHRPGPALSDQWEVSITEGWAALMGHRVCVRGAGDDGARRQIWVWFPQPCTRNLFDPEQTDFEKLNGQRAKPSEIGAAELETKSERERMEVSTL